jgi:hypothetical protein
MSGLLCKSDEADFALLPGGEQCLLPIPCRCDDRSTSVGTQVIFSFTRPVCYQGFPDEALPQELKDANPLGIWRMVNEQMMRSATWPALSIQG